MGLIIHISYGGYHGFLLIIQATYTKFRKKWKQKNSKILIGTKIAVVFVAVNIGWIFFRSESVTEAFWIINNLLNFSQESFWGEFENLPISSIAMLILPLVLLAIIDIENYLQGNIIDWISKKKVYIRWTVYTVFVFIIFIYLPVTSVQKQFIYFQF